MKMKRVCSYCNKDMGEKEPPGEFVKNVRKKKWIKSTKCLSLHLKFTPKKNKKGKNDSIDCRNITGKKYLFSY